MVSDFIKIEADLQFRVLDSAMNLAPSRLAELQRGEIVSKLTRDTYAIGRFPAQGSIYRKSSDRFLYYSSPQEHPAPYSRRL